MPRLSIRHRNLAGLAFLSGVAVVLSACLPAITSAQSGKAKKGAAEPEKKSGTIAAVEKKGKTATITVEEADGEKFDVPINAKSNFVVHGKGDTTFFKHSGLFVSADDVVRNPTNGYMHGRKFKIFIGGKGPGERLEQDPLSAEVCKIAGPVVDADDESFSFEAEGGVHKVGLDPAGVDVSVESTEIDHAVVGSEIEVAGTTRAGKFSPTGITVTLEKPMSATEAFAGEKKTAKSKSGSKTTGKKTTAKNDKADKTGDKGADANDKGKVDTKDPFGVNKVDDNDDGSKKDPKDTKPGKTPAPKKPKKPATNSDMNN
jgi:hypothetical protein